MQTYIVLYDKVLIHIVKSWKICYQPHFLKAEVSFRPSESRSRKNLSDNME